MGSLKTTLSRFGKGLVTDAITAGALLEANNVVPLQLNSGWRLRGGKRAINIGSAGGQRLYPSPYGAGIQQLVGVAILGGTPRLIAWDGNATTYQALNDQALNPAGGALAFPGVTNKLGGTPRYASSEPVRYAGELWIPGSQSVLPSRYAGISSALADYTTGTVSIGAGSNGVVHSGTGFTAANGVFVGDYIYVPHASVQDRAFKIIAITSSSTLLVDRPFPTTAAAQTFRITKNAWWSVKPGTFGASAYTGGSIVSFSTMQATCVAQHQGRVFGGNTAELNNLYNADRLRWSAVDAETDALYSGTGQWGGAEYWHPNAYIDVYPGEGGQQGIMALASYGGNLFIFKRSAVYVLRGNVETDGRDVGAAIDVVTTDDGLWSNTAPIVTADGVIFAGQNGLYMLNGSGIVNITDRDGVRVAYKGLGVARMSWTGERLILQNNVKNDDVSTVDGYNTLIWYPKLGVWCTQRTWLTTRVLSASGQSIGGDEVGIGLSTEAVNVAGQGIRWCDDNDFSVYAVSGINTAYFGRSEVPQLRLTTHPVPLKGQRNGRVRSASLRAKLINNANLPNQQLTVSVILGEEGVGTTSAPEPAISAATTGPPAAAQAFVGKVTPQTEKWKRMNFREGVPAVANFRLSIRDGGPSLDCRVYEAEVEHVTVARDRR